MLEEKKKENAEPKNDQTAPFIVLSSIKKDYIVNKKTYPAIRGIDIAFPRVGFVAILGESGSGKTTLLNLIGGLDRYTDGDILVEGISTKNYKGSDWDHYRNSRIGFVFQSYNLVSHETILHNVELPLKLGGTSRKEAEERALFCLEQVGLGPLAKKKPNELSGGQMQRVAIARAIANQPDVVLADEPTGALDSETSVQVMDLLASMTKDRLVIMVTHNRELAEKYATRIIEMKDGLVVRDSNPMPLPQESGALSEQKTKKKTSMSFFTALRTSFLSILTKKGRSSLTALACSIGIIGVGLVLATTTGFSSYVTQVESGIASSVPISIAPTIYSVNTKSVTSPDSESFPSDDKVHIYNTNANLYVSHQNKFTQEYIDYLSRIKNDPTCPVYGSAMSVMFNRSNLDFHFLTADGKDGEHIRRISQYTWAGETAYSINSYTQLPTYIMHELYGDEKSMSSLYDVIYGRFPTKANEMVLIVDRYNRVEFSTLQRTGIISTSTQYADLVNEGTKMIDFSSIVADSEEDTDCKVYRCYTNSDYFQVNYLEPNETTRATYENVHYDATQDEFVGTETTKTFKSYINADLSSIDYPYDYVYNNGSGRLHPIECKIVGVIRPTRQSFLQLMPASIGYLPSLTQMMTDDYAEGGAGHILAETEAQNWYLPRLYKEDGVTKSSSDALEILNERVLPLIKDMQTKSVEEISSLLTSTYITNILNGVIYYVGATCTQQTEGGHYNGPGITSSISTYLAWSNTFGTEFDTSKVPAMSMTQESIDAWINVMLAKKFFDVNGSPSIVECLAYMNAYSLISNILVFPASLTTKDALKAYLDNWNVGKQDVDMITYSDVMTDVTSGLGALISVISSVLIVFASISLVVSSVMTAIITYISVVERTKEIGIIRACGGRKRDVGRLFEAECVIVGFVAGALGIAVTYILCSPINIILKQQFPAYVYTDIAYLSPWFALGLVAISVLLALFSGFIPALVAAKKDPVVCLRSDS